MPRTLHRREKVFAKGLFGGHGGKPCRAYDRSSLRWD